MNESSSTHNSGEAFTLSLDTDTTVPIENRSRLLAEMIRQKMASDTADLFEGIKIPLEEGEQAE